ncbi:Uncharacterised protein [Yersinia enterocolitica]|nr:Uncharacterised protein [Yersinia enterocolitica]
MFDAMPESLAGHLLAAVAGEEHIQRLTIDKPRSPVLHIILNPINGFFAQRHEPLFIAFTDNPHDTLAQTHVADGQTNQFRYP